jgi:hypothetical protein
LALLEEHVLVERRHKDLSSFDFCAVLRNDDRQGTAQEIRQQQRAVRRSVQDDENRGGNVARQQLNQLAQGLRAAGRSSNHHDVAPRRRIASRQSAH